MTTVSKINAKLNLVIPVDTTTGTIHVFSTPLSREVFQEYYMLLSKTFSAIYGEGLGFVAGPRVSLLLLRDIAKGMGEAYPAKVEAGLIAEMWRLTNVIVAGEIVPFQEIVSKGILDEDDLGEVENAITFFIVASAIHKRAELQEMLEGASRLWGAQVTSLDFMAFAASLKTSTQPDPSGVKKTPSSLPV